MINFDVVVAKYVFPAMSFADANWLRTQYCILLLTRTGGHRSLWSKSVDWRALKISRSAHLWRHSISVWTYVELII